MGILTVVAALCVVALAARGGKDDRSRVRSNHAVTRLAPTLGGPELDSSGGVLLGSMVNRIAAQGNRVKEYVTNG
jgi:hypothetical protein